MQIPRNHQNHRLWDLCLDTRRREQGARVGPFLLSWGLVPATSSVTPPHPLGHPCCLPFTAASRSHLPSEIVKGGKQLQ